MGQKERSSMTLTNSAISESIKHQRFNSMGTINRLDQLSPISVPKLNLKNIKYG